MATYTLNATDKGAYEKTLVASTVDTVNFARPVYQDVEVITDGSDEIYVTVGNTGNVTDPTVAGATTYILPAFAHSCRIPVSGALGNTTVKLISAGTPVYSVAETFLVRAGGGGGGASGSVTIGETVDTNEVGSLNASGQVLASAARTATTNSNDLTNLYGAGVTIYLDVTATPNDAQTLTLSVQGKDPVSSKWVTLTAFAALTASTLGAAPTTETYVYKVYPGIAETAAVSKHEVQAINIGRTFRVVATHSAAGSWTYSVGYALNAT